MSPSGFRPLADQRQSDGCPARAFEEAKDQLRQIALKLRQVRFERRDLGLLRGGFQSRRRQLCLCLTRLFGQHLLKKLDVFFVENIGIVARFDGRCGIGAMYRRGQERGQQPKPTNHGGPLFRPQRR